MKLVMVEIQEIRSFKKSPAAAGNGNGICATAEGSSQQSRAAWRTVIDTTLTKWVREPLQLDDDGLKAPSAELISLAEEFAQYCATHAVDAPLRIVPDGSGGIVFEWKLGPHFTMVELRADGRMELMCYRNSVLQSRESIG